MDQSTSTFCRRRLVAGLRRAFESMDCGAVAAAQGRPEASRALRRRGRALAAESLARFGGESAGLDPRPPALRARLRRLVDRRSPTPPRPSDG